MMVAVTGLPSPSDLDAARRRTPSGHADVAIYVRRSNCMGGPKLEYSGVYCHHIFAMSLMGKFIGILLPYVQLEVIV